MVKNTVLEGLPQRKQPYLKKQLQDGSWQPLTRVSRKKSEIKALLRTHERVKQAFLVGTLPNTLHLGKAIEDCSYTWIKFSKVQSVAREKAGVEVTGEHVVRFMLNKAVEFFEAQPHSNTYVMVFDKPAHVPPNKKEEQLWRLIGYGSDQIEPYHWDPETEPHILEWNKPVPCRWEALKANRAAREQSIRDTVRLIAQHYVPPPGKRLIVDSDVDMDQGPLVLATPVSGLGHECYRDARLINCIGEGDNCVLFYVSLFSSGGADVDAHRGNFLDRCSWNGTSTDDILIHANDTDIWLNLLMSYRQRQQECDFVNRVYVHCGDTSIAMSGDSITTTILSSSSSSSTDATTTTTTTSDDSFLSAFLQQQESAVLIQGYTTAVIPSKRLTEEQQMVSKLREYIDMNSLFDAVADLHLLSEDQQQILPYAIESMFVICIMGGNDYVDGYYGLSYTVLMRTWLREYKTIGNLVELVDMPHATDQQQQQQQQISINPASYISLLMRAYWYAYEKPNITRPDPNNPPKHRTKPNFPKPISQMSLDELRQLVSKLRKRSTDHVPPTEEIIAKMLRTQWYLRYCYYSYKAQPLHYIPAPQRSGWEFSTVKYRTKLGHKKTLQNIMTRRLL